jgi:hypothetical protein
MRKSATIRAVGSEVLAEDTGIGFPVPYEQEILSKTLGRHIWQMIQWVFRLPPLELKVDLTRLDPGEHDILDRYVSKAAEMAASPYLGFPSSLNISFGIDREEILANFPNRESTAGFLVGFRQYFDAGETASYARVHLIVRSTAAAQDLRDDVKLLDAWGRVHKKLCRRPPKTWVELKVHRRDTDKTGSGTNAGITNLHHPRTSELIETYLYGDMVHYGSGRDRLAAIGSEEFSAASHEMSLHEGVAGLSMFYLGVASGIRDRLSPS